MDPKSYCQKVKYLVKTQGVGSLFARRNNLPKLGWLGWIQFVLNFVIIIAGFILAGYFGGSVATADPRLGLQFLGIGFGLMGLGWALISSQFNGANLAEIKKILDELKCK